MSSCNNDYCHSVHQITQLKINNNPYARAFRESIPGESSGLERKGGHYKDRDFSHSPTHIYQENTGSGSRLSSKSSPTPGSSPRRAETPTTTTGNVCSSNTSVESGMFKKYYQKSPC